MDIATLVGILLGLGFTVGGIAMAAIAAGASAMVFISVSSFVIVFGGVFADSAVKSFYFHFWAVSGPHVGRVRAGTFSDSFARLLFAKP